MTERRNTALRLSDDQYALAKQVAATLPPLARGVPNVSEAIRYILTEWAAGRGRPDSAKRVLNTATLRDSLERVRVELDRIEKEVVS